MAMVLMVVLVVVVMGGDDDGDGDGVLCGGESCASSERQALLGGSPLNLLSGKELSISCCYVTAMVCDGGNVIVVLMLMLMRMVMVMVMIAVRVMVGGCDYGDDSVTTG